MKYYPMLMDIKDRDCLVIGAGPVGERKAKMLVRCGACVTMVSPKFFDKQKDLESLGIQCIHKLYDQTDLNGRFMVFAATGQRKLNQAIQEDAQKMDILCNVADAPDDSDFILPSVVQRGDLILTASTSGASPALAKNIRKQLELSFGPEYETILLIMGRIRKKLLVQEHAPDKHKKLFYTLIESGLLEMIKHHRENDINALLSKLFGEDYTFKELVS